MKNIKRWLGALLCALMCVLLFAACIAGNPGSSAGVTDTPGKPDCVTGVTDAAGNPDCVTGVTGTPGKPDCVTGVTDAAGNPDCVTGVTGTAGNPGGSTVDVTPTPTPTGTSAASDGNTPNAPDKLAMKAGDVYRIFLWSNTAENQYVDGLTGGIRAGENRYRWLKFQEQYGVTVTWIANPGGDWMQQVLATAASGEPICDIYHMGGPFIIPPSLTYGNTKVGYYYENLADYAEYADFSDNAYWDQSAQETMGHYDGKFFVAFPQEVGWGSVAVNQVCFLNKTLLERGGHSANEIYNLYKEGNWTFDKFRDIAKDCTNVDRGIYGTLIAQNGMSLLSLITANGGSVLTPDESGVPKFTADSKKSMTAINYFLDMCRKDKSVLTDGSISQQEATLFKSGSVAMMLTYANRVTEGEGPRKGALYQQQDIKYGIVLPPKGPDAQDYMSDKNWSIPISVFKGHENPAGVVQCLNLYMRPLYALGSEESNLALEIDAVTYFQDEESIKVLHDILEKNVSTSYMVYWAQTIDGISLAGVTTYGIDMWIKGESTPEVDYAAGKKAINGILSGLYNGR
ncbi:MAG: extracellular solute-binding protein [Firmicutes bacterium]|nr:extracellular solute-binding protein [Bacillota bacterium]